GAHPGDFIVTTPPDASVPAGESSVFTVRFDPDALGVRSATLHVISDDPAKGDYDFAVRGLGIEPDVKVLGIDLSEIPDGDATPQVADGTDFGSNRVTVGYIEHTFTVTNEGTTVLNITGVTTNGTHPSDFIVTNQPAASIPAGGATAFTLRFDPTALGSRSAVMHLTTDDPDTPDYDFTVQGLGVEPEIAVLGIDLAVIVDGDATPQVADGTDFTSNRVTVGFIDHEFTVTNSGTTVLNITGVTTNGSHPGDFIVTVPPDAAVAMGNTTTFTLRFDPSALGVREATIHVINDDDTEADYTFDVTGLGVEPEIAVLGTNLAVITDGDVTPQVADGTDFGDIDVSAGTADHIFTITNSGSTVLNITGVTTGGLQAADFILTSQPDSSVAMGDTTTFTIQFDPRSLGERLATILIANDDADENPYTFTVKGTGVEPDMAVLGTNLAEIVNGDVTPSLEDGTHFGDVDVSSGTKSHIFTITNNGTKALGIGNITTSGLQAVEFAVTALPAASIDAGQSTTFTVEFDPNSLGPRNATLSISNDDPDEDPYTFALRGIGVEPDIALLGTNLALIANGDVTPSLTDGTDYGDVDVSSGLSDHIFTITNTGTKALGISNITTAGAHAAEFIITAQPDPSIPINGASTFTLRFNPADLGVRTATLLISNDDPDEDPYTFSIQGTGVEPDISVLGTNLATIVSGDNTPSMIDGTDFGSNRVTTGYIEHIFTITNSGTEALNITGITTNGSHPDDFIVSLPPGSPVDINATTTFTLRFDPTALGVRSAIVHVNSDDPDTADYSFTVTGLGIEPEIAVLGTNLAVITDGDVTPSLADGTDFTSNRVTVGFIEHEFTVTNSGTTVLNITGITTNGPAPQDFIVVTPPSASIGMGETTTFTLRFDPTTLGVRDATIHVGNDDADEPDYTFDVTGLGIEPEIAVLGTNLGVIADGDAVPSFVDGTDFGSNRVSVGFLEHTFTITNQGTTVLNVTGVTTNGAHPDNFIVVTPPAASVPMGGASAFTVRFDPDALGLRAATLHVLSDDDDEADYDFAVQGLGIEPDAVILGTNLAVITSGDATPAIADGTDFG
ncbi:MAG: choice-of-anchor D domain-containing protein, partial [Spartobacteria bacterium]|nr:choice-of-anchor D domain-containing protein [Spartobacteria bacterium]